MGDHLVKRLREQVRHIDEMRAFCEECSNGNPNPIVRRRFRFARRGLGVARLAFLSILALLGAAAV